MKSKTGKRDKIVKVLYQKKLSARLIAAKLSISLRRVYLSLVRQNIPRRLPAEQNKISFDNKPLSYFYKQPKTERLKLLEVAALMLYKGEGAKSGFTVDLANSDKVVLIIFLNYLRKICHVDEKRIKLYLYCFSNQNSGALKKYWSKSLNIPPSFFTKPYIRKVSHSGSLRIMPYGLLHIRYSDKKLLNHILALIDQTAKKMIK